MESKPVNYDRKGIPLMVLFIPREEILNAILETIEEGILVLDKDKEIIHVNDRFVAMYKLEYMMICTSHRVKSL